MTEELGHSVVHIVFQIEKFQLAQVRAAVVPGLCQQVPGLLAAGLIALRAVVQQGGAEGAEISLLVLRYAGGDDALRRQGRRPRRLGQGVPVNGQGHGLPQGRVAEGLGRAVEQSGVGGQLRQGGPLRVRRQLCQTGVRQRPDGVHGLALIEGPGFLRRTGKVEGDALGPRLGGVVAVIGGQLEEAALLQRGDGVGPVGHQLGGVPFPPGLVPGGGFQLLHHVLAQGHGGGGGADLL